jgi:integrase
LTRSAGLPPFTPHLLRKTLVDLASTRCRAPEEFKAWSQNLGHEDVLTTFRSYGAVSPGRQREVMLAMDADDFQVLDLG